MSEMLTFTVDLPPALCSPNQNAHYQSKARARRSYREDVGWTATEARNKRSWPPADRVRVSLTFATQRSPFSSLTRSYRPKDIDNAIASWKGGLDGLVDAGIVVADDAGHVEWGLVVIDAKEGPWVRVLIERLEVLR